VTNIYLDALFHEGLELDYLAPIVSQQGEVAGRLRFRLKRLAGRLPQDRLAHCEALSEASGGQESNHEEEDNNNLFTFSLAIIEAVGIPAAYSQFIFCEYSSWWAGGGESESLLVPPVHDVSDTAAAPTNPLAAPGTFRFDHCRQWTVPLSEEFIDFCSDSALSIEVYGHKLLPGTTEELGEGQQQHEWVAGQATRARSLADRWQELTRKVELRVDIQELNEEGDYAPVEVLQEVGGCGGVFQLRQGQQRRISVTVRPTSNQLGSEGGMLPLLCDAVVEVAVGGPCMRSRLQRPLDSYQEEDLGRLRERWSEALDRRRQYLEAQIKQYLARTDKTEAEAEREQSLVEQWVHLTEERNAVLVPAEHSGVPGAPTPADRVPSPGTELHHPVLFLDLQPGEFACSADDSSLTYEDEEYEDADVALPLYCHQSILPKELHGGKFYSLPILRQYEEETAVVAVASWDSSIHDSVYLNRITEPGERAYLIVKAIVRLTHPRRMDLMLRKRICFNVYKQQRSSLSDRIRRRLAGVAVATVSAAMGSCTSSTGTVNSVGVIYDLVAHVPKASEELEARESLAAVAAASSGGGNTTAAAQEEFLQADGETFIEKYTRSAAAVEELMRLDKMRQQVAVRELAARANTPNNKLPTGRQSMRKTFSVPNFRHMMKSSLSLDSLANIRSPLRPSESFSDLNCEMAGRLTTGTRRGIDYSMSGHNNGSSDEGDSTNGRHGSSAGRRLPLSLTMSTLHEEKSSCNRQTEEDSTNEIGSPRKNSPPTSRCATDSKSAGVIPVYDDYHESYATDSMTKSQTAESISELQKQHQVQQQQQQPSKNGSPSLLSSGYESQAVSLTTLSSEDSLSVRSMSVEEETQEGESDIGRLCDVAAAEVNHHHHRHHNSKAVISEDERSHVVVLRRSNPALRKQQNHRLSCPSSLISLNHHNTTNSSITRSRTRVDNSSSAEGINGINNNLSREEEEEEGEGEGGGGGLPDWLTLGESVQVRPSNLSGVVRFVGPAQFAPGLWVGIELDTSRGKNDGCVDGVRYFSCPARRGMFVRPKSVKLDRRGRDMRAAKAADGRDAHPAKNLGRTKSKQSLGVKTIGIV
jgi:kinesin family protein 13